MTILKNTAVVYVLGDVDRVREHIDRHLLAENLPSLKVFSAGLTKALLNLASAVEAMLNAQTIMAGGDDVLFQIPYQDYSQDLLKQIAQSFSKETGCRISFGVGKTVSAAYLNLRRAKAEGRGSIVSSEE
jgi:GTP cyclohydrolase III